MPPGGDVAVLLLDVEGTTTPVAFVYDVLFPYALEGVGSFLEESMGRDDVAAEMAALREERLAELPRPDLPPWDETTPALFRASAAAYARWLMGLDRKTTALKALQGRIWEAGYRKGALAGQVYPDVAWALRRWKRQGRRAAVFSSGSVLAQKLLFETTPAGDLTALIEAHFDTGTGSKQDARSYQAIAGRLGVPPGRILFLSDVAAELDAARQAGMRTALCLRSQGPPGTRAHPVIRSFDTVFP